MLRVVILGFFLIDKYIKDNFVFGHTNLCINNPCIELFVKKKIAMLVCSVFVRHPIIMNKVYK